MNVLDGLLLQLLDRLGLGVFSLDDGLGFGLPRASDCQHSEKGARQAQRIVSPTGQDTHSQGLVPSRGILRVRALLCTGKVLVLLLFKSVGIGSGHLSITHWISAHDGRDNVSRAKAYDRSGMVRVAETENARTGVLLAARKTAVDRVNSMVGDRFLKRRLWRNVHFFSNGISNRRGIYNTPRADRPYDVCTCPPHARPIGSPAYTPADYSRAPLPVGGHVRHGCALASRFD